MNKSKIRIFMDVVESKPEFKAPNKAPLELVKKFIDNGYNKFIYYYE
jgi:hypothetical protein